ncbi:hypothetical protein CONPUDRAFT_167159 [Coniophora puteana RWD-64-598 SS2]|uniref:Uncharacterized protein n=1 Tax=Coniophora puteana (strain RWD-64-598) TaxID=741705 RepID=A0A5M3ML62_CONPW|nr:uncharacterized protein CONPUDRAFT_167159 [Coniophora puteana RWD-64-598 SS2]EIW79405.1 hypothetical protein CONPUDRAFT_167159 [Coniophora puteana RWD-64-598 SS2]
MAGIPTPSSPVNAWSSTSAVEDARSELDEEMDALRRKECQLKTRRNALSRICVVPPEILSLVFLYYVDSASDHHIPFHTHKFWIRAISHICRHWREVALSSPALWTRFADYHCLPFTEEMLKRSGSSPLDVTLMIDTDGHTATSGHALAAPRRVLEDIHRIRELDLSISISTAKCTFERLAAPTLLLTSLIVTNIKGRYPPYTPVQIPKSAIPNNFLGFTPVLRKLKFYRCDIPWDLPLLKGLTELGIAHVSTDARPTYQQLLYVLRQMPALKRLSLVEVLPTSGTSAEESTVRLPELEQLFVGCSPTQCAQLLRCLLFPGSTRVKLVCKGTGRAEDYTSMVSMLRERCFPPLDLNATKPRECLAIWKAYTNGHNMKIGLRRFNGKLTDPDTLKGWRLLIDLRSFQSEVSVTAFLVSLFAEASIPSICAVQVFDLPQLPVDLWHNLLSCASKTRTLAVGCTYPHAIRNLVSVLGPTVSQSPSPGTSERQDVKLPHLDKLILWGVEFEDDYQEPTGQHPSVDLSELYDFLIARVNADAGLGKLDIRECFGFYEGDDLFLQEVVPHVIWDGQEQDPYEQDSSESGVTVGLSDDNYGHDSYRRYSRSYGGYYDEDED